jgi:hypothetical protein
LVLACATYCWPWAVSLVALIKVVYVPRAGLRTPASSRSILILIEETLPDPSAGRSTCWAGRADSRMWWRCCRLTEGFSHFVTSIAAPVASGWSGCRVGFAPTGKVPPFHGAHPELTQPSLHASAVGEAPSRSAQPTTLLEYSFMAMHLHQEEGPPFALRGTKMHFSPS